MKNILLIAAMLLSNVASASVITTTKITSILISETYGNFAFLTISAKPGNAPACQTNPVYSYALDLSTPMGKSLLGLIMLAQSSGKDVYLSGADVCPSFGIEKLLQVEVK